MKTLFATGVIALMTSQAFAQTPGGAESNLATPTGHDLSAGVSSYTYREPDGDQPISIHAPKFVAEYTGTLSLNKRRHLFMQAQVRGTVGNTTYNGFCSPFLINPNSESPNGYELDIGGASPCDESGDRDWYVEGRALVGKDLIGQRWGWSPYSGLGLRHLSNGTTGSPGYRTDDYLYLPVGLTTRTGVGSHGALSSEFRIRRPAARVAEHPRLVSRRRRRAGDVDGASVHSRWLYGYLVLSVRRMGRAGERNISVDPTCLAGAVPTCTGTSPPRR